MEQNLEVELDLAQLDLAGSRYEAASRKYEAIIRNSPHNSIAWCGMGMAKYGILLDGSATVSEVFYCFDKAKSLATEKGVVEAFAMQNSFEVIKGLHEAFINNQNASEQIKNQKLNSIATFAVSTLIGVASKNKSMYTDLAALGGNAIAYKDYMAANNNKRTLEERQKHIINLVKEIRDSILNFVTGRTNDVIEFKKATGKLQSEIKRLNNPAKEIKRLSPFELEKRRKEKTFENANGTLAIIIFLFIVVFVCFVKGYSYVGDNDTDTLLCQIGLYILSAIAFIISIRQIPVYFKEKRLAKKEYNDGSK